MVAGPMPYCWINFIFIQADHGSLIAVPENLAYLERPSWSSVHWEHNKGGVRLQVGLHQAHADVKN